LIHRDSILSPYNNPNENPAHRVQRGINISIARLAYLQEKIRSHNTYQAQILPSNDISNSLFYVNISIGQPPVPQFTAMDTGSSLLWVHCYPCRDCSPQLGTIFYPSRSSSYAYVPCDSEHCRYFPYARCSAYKHRCIYTQLYLIGPETSVFVSTEQLTFKNTDESTIHVQDVVFGCGFSTNRNFKFSGIFGLGIGRSSLVSQLNSSFSYCIGSLHDPDYLHNKLILGDGAIIDEGDATPLQFIDGHYYITLEAISVDGRMLDINPNIFKRDDSGGGVMIDSGTDVTWLVKEAYEALRDEVMIRLEGEQMRSYSWPDKLCYHGIMSSDLKGFPTVRFHFRGGAKLALEKDSMFYQPRPDAFCMAVNPASINNRYVNFSLIGMMAQQFYNVGYDIGRKQKTFQRMDCEVLDDD
ncbi:hypothetical protein CISIN_1g038667mg, partial [Citrus sinensis]